MLTFALDADEDESESELGDEPAKSEANRPAAIAIVSKAG